MLVLSVLLSGAGNYQREIRYECSDIALSHRLSPRAATRFRSKAGTSTLGWLLQKSPPRPWDHRVRGWERHPRSLCLTFDQMPPCHQVPPLQGLVAQGSWLAQLGQGPQSPMSAKTTAWPPMVPWPLEQDPVIKQGFSTALSLPWVPNPPAQAGDEVWSPSALCSGALGPAVSVGETIPSNSIQFHPIPSKRCI